MAAIPLTSTITATPGASTGTTLSAIANGNNASASVSGGTGVALVPISQFNPATGILVGATVTASVPVSVTTVVTGVVPASGTGRNITSTATYTGAVTGPGVSIAGSTISATKGCSGGNCANSPNNQTATTNGSIAGTAAVSSGALASYYGSGSVNLATAGSFQSTVQNGSNVTTGNGDATVARTAGASYQLVYSYLNFASPSFNGSTVQTGLTLNFGTRNLNSAPVTINFSLFNIGNANSAGFDLISVTPTNSNPLFTTTLAPFTNSVAGGSSRNFSATFAPTILGAQVESWRLRLRDSAADVGAGLGARDYEMVVDAISMVLLPEPGTWATMIIGFGLVGATMRRRRMLLSN